MKRLTKEQRRIRKMVARCGGMTLVVLVSLWMVTSACIRDVAIFEDSNNYDCDGYLINAVTAQEAHYDK